MARILIVEDDTQMREMLKQMLTREGYEVADAPDGKVALKLFREKPADIVITDLIMPEKEGIETIRELRRDFPELKIIAIPGGGHTLPEDYLMLAKGLGANHALSKPLERKELLEAVQSLL